MTVEGAERRARGHPRGGRWGRPPGVDPGSPRGGQPVLRRRPHLGPDGPGVPPRVADPRWRLRALRDDPAARRTSSEAVGAPGPGHGPRGLLDGRVPAGPRRSADLHGGQPADGRLGRPRHRRRRELPAAAGRLEAGRPLQEVGGYEVGRRLRWLPGDIWNLRSVFGSQGQPDVPSRGRAVAAFVGDFRRLSTTVRRRRAR